MTLKEEILEKLTERRNLMLEFERISEAIYIAPTEEIEPMIDKRQDIIEQVDALNAHVEALCNETEDEVREAVRNRGNRGELSSELADIYDMALQAACIAARAKQSDSMIRERIIIERDNANRELEKLSESSAVVAGGYGRTMQTGAAPISTKNYIAQI